MTQEEVLFRSVFFNSTLIVIVASLIVGGIMTVLAFAYEKAIGCIMLGVTLFIAFLVGPINAYVSANAAIGADWEQAIDDKSTYLEKLHGVWSRYDIEVHTCTYQDNDIRVNDTGCEYVTVDSYCDSYDDEGDCDDTDYEFFPWFTEERTYTAELNIFKRGHMVFASHLAPPDWQNYDWYKPFFAEPSGDFEYQIPYEWERVRNAIDKGEILPGSVWNPYFNWIFADDFSILEEYSPHIDQYRDAGLLPTINMITDSTGREIKSNIRGNTTGVGFGYEIVQFLDITVPQQEYERWQNTAHLWAAMAGPSVQASLIMFFAPAESVGSRHEWVHTSKAYLMTEEDEEGKSVFGRYILPKNVILIGCGVSGDLQKVEWCEAETGMFKGNERFLENVRQLESFAFTPEVVFGNHTAVFVTDGGIRVLEDPDWDDREVEIYVPEIKFTGGVIDEVIRDPDEGFTRLEMAEFEEKRIVIQPDPEQIDGIKSAKRMQAFMVSLISWGVVIAFIVAGSRRQS